MLLPTGFIPDEDTSRVVISAELPPGSRLEDTRAVTDEIVKRLKNMPEVKSVFVLGGTSPTGQLELRRAPSTCSWSPRPSATSRRRN